VRILHDPLAAISRIISLMVLSSLGSPVSRPIWRRLVKSRFHITGSSCSRAEGVAAGDPECAGIFCENGGTPPYDDTFK
jgi:hypothetical protein